MPEVRTHKQDSPCYRASRSLKIRQFWNYEQTQKSSLTLMSTDPLGVNYMDQIPQFVDIVSWSFLKIMI